ncbi:MAG: DNA polymerase IV [Thermoplasmata archaeon]
MGCATDVARWFFWVDMDAFYVNCEILDRPELRGLPVVVGHRPGRGPARSVILSASYEARRFGIRSALPARQALALCPEAVWIPPDFAKYERRSSQVLAWLRARFGPVEPRSIDEALIPVGADSAVELVRIAKAAQGALRSDLGLPSSWGGAPHPLVAKMATDRAKPGGVFVVPPESLAEYLGPLAVDAVPGIGPKTAARLRGEGIETLADLGRRSSPWIRRILGEWGLAVADLVRGHVPGIPPLRESDAPLSRSADRTFDQDLGEWEMVRAAVMELSARLAASVAAEGLSFATVSVAFRWSDWRRVQRMRRLPGATDRGEALATTAQTLAREMWGGRVAGPTRRVRTVTVRVSTLRRAASRQPALDDPSEGSAGTAGDGAPPPGF